MVLVNVGFCISSEGSVLMGMLIYVAVTWDMFDVILFLESKQPAVFLWV